MGDQILIRLADFSRYPSGREDVDGDFNGSRYRREILAPAIHAAQEKHETILISLDDVLSFGSSFLEEAFGGLVRKGIATKSFLRQSIKIDARKPSHERAREAIMQYIESAKAP